jgi:hypothetical protein
MRTLIFGAFSLCNKFFLGTPWTQIIRCKDPQTLVQIEQDKTAPICAYSLGRGWKVEGDNHHVFHVVSHVTVIDVQLTLCSWAVLERPLKNFPALYGTRSFITLFTRALDLSQYMATTTKFLWNWQRRILSSTATSAKSKEDNPGAWAVRQSYKLLGWEQSDYVASMLVELVGE